VRIGIHTSIAGELKNAALRASELGANAFQIFSCSPRSWNFAGVDPEAAIDLRRTREKLDLRPLVVHDNYLINLASPDETIRRKSIAAFRAEIGRALAVGANYLVMHPGSSKGQAAEQAIGTLVSSLAEAAEGIMFDGLTILLENTAGAGGTMGVDFRELGQIIDAAGGDPRLGICLDTAHIFESGADLRTREGVDLVLRELDEHCGRDRLVMLHLNDSKTPLGSNRDRHENIGDGDLGEEAFRLLVNEPAFEDLPGILEVPGLDGSGPDRENLARLRALVD